MCACACACACVCMCVRARLCLCCILAAHFTCPQKTTQLKKMLTSNDLEFIMEAHNGLSAKIVEEAGMMLALDSYQ